MTDAIFGRLSPVDSSGVPDLGVRSGRFFFRAGGGRDADGEGSRAESFGGAAAGEPRLCFRLMCCWAWHFFWVNYDDLTRPHPKRWFMWATASQPPSFRLVQYYNSPRCFVGTLSGSVLFSGSNAVVMNYVLSNHGSGPGGFPKIKVVLPHLSVSFYDCWREEPAYETSTGSMARCAALQASNPTDTSTPEHRFLGVSNLLFADVFVSFFSA